MSLPRTERNLAFGIPQQIVPLEQNLSAKHFSRRRRDQPQHGHRRNGLSAAAFAHQRNGLTRIDAEGRIAHGMDVAAVGFKRNVEVFDLQQKAWASAINLAFAVAGQWRRGWLHRSDCRRRRSGRSRVRGRSRSTTGTPFRRAGLVEQLAPARFINQAKTEEAQRRFEQDCRCHAEAGVDQHRGHAVGQHVAEDDRAQRQSRGDRGLHEIEVSQSQEFCADEPRVPCPNSAGR